MMQWQVGKLNARAFVTSIGWIAWSLSVTEQANQATEKHFKSGHPGHWR
jgi:hypothetical protein